MGADVLCGRPAGSCIGVMAVENFLGRMECGVYNDQAYSIYYTRKGLKFVHDDFREGAAKSCKMYGYYNQYLEGCQFQVCKECLDSEEFGIMVLAGLP